MKETTFLESMNIYVNRPRVVFDTVYFSFTPSHEMTEWSVYDFYMKYEGLNIENIDINVQYNTFIGLFLGFISYTKYIHFTINLIFEDSIALETINLWINYFKISNVSFFPIELIKLSTNKTELNLEYNTVGILYGGGKDSLAALSIFSEVFENKKIIIIPYVTSVSSDYRLKNQKRDKFAINPVREYFQVTVQKVYSNILQRIGYGRLGMELYFASIVPLLIKYNIGFLTSSLEYCHYWIKQNNKIKKAEFDLEEKQISFRTTRNEVLLFLSERYSRFIGSITRILNFNFCLSELSAFKYLGLKHSNFIELIMMCESIENKDIKWCQNCTKCATFVLFCLFFNIDQNDIDVDQFFSSSGWILKIKKYLSKSLENNKFMPGSNYTWFPALTFLLHFDSFCHVIYSLNLEKIKIDYNLSLKSYENLLLLKKLYGNLEYPAEPKAYLDALKVISLQPEIEKKIIDAISPYIEWTESPKKKNCGNSTVYYDLYYKESFDLHDTSYFSQNIYLEKIAQSLVSNSRTEPNYLDCSSAFLKYQIKGENSNTLLRYNSSPYSIEAWLYKTNPHKGDFISVNYLVELPRKKSNNNYIISFEVMSPYYNLTVKKRCEYYVLIDDKLLMAEDISDFPGINLITLADNWKENQVKITVQTIAIINCEPWNWGQAMKIKLQKIYISSCPPLSERVVSITSPFAKKYF